MKKIAFIALALISLITTTTAQGIFKKGDKIVNLGIGFGDNIYYGSGYKTTLPLIAGSFEYGIIDNLFNDKSSIGVGGLVGYSQNKQNLAYGHLKYTHIIAGARGAFHYQFLDKLDTYAGIMLGYDFISHKYSESDDRGIDVDGNAFAYSNFVGARYYFSPNFAAYAEAGYGITLLQLGASIKF